MSEHTEAMNARAAALARAGSLDLALAGGLLPPRIDCTVSEALVLGLLRQGVRAFVGVFGHGSTDLGEVLRVYAAHGLCRVFSVRHETEAAHAATALRWVTGERAAVFTSIGPGALQALAGSLAAASDGVGVWHLYGDETTEDEGPNMQQIPREEQQLFLRLCSAMGGAYALHTPGALATALRRGQAVVDHPYRAGPFFLLLPMNVQPRRLQDFALAELPGPAPWTPGPCDAAGLEPALDALQGAGRIVVKAGGGALGAGAALRELVERTGAVLVHTPIAAGVIPSGHPACMGVGGSKGTICGNFAMEEAELLLAVGTRAVCQSDSSRTGYLRVRQVVSVNADPAAALHYGRTLPLVGDARLVVEALCRGLEARGHRPTAEALAWRAACTAKKAEWEAFKEARYARPRLHDPLWGREVLTQPAAIRTALAWARERGVKCFFDAGDVQANGFQVATCDAPGEVFTETGASYMGFAVSALLATAMASRPFAALALTGDGSFTMNPQVLIDGVACGARGIVLLLDNRRMAAISGLQRAQYGVDFATWDHVPVDYLAWAGAVPGVLPVPGGDDPEALRRALDRAHAHPGLALVHLPVYWGDDPLGGLGAFGRWNVGSWVEATERLRHGIGL
jgi:3D-(3,5/4)-trihydroxycyclohexane-1,2-dione acylhydrolase (decyclizing)